MKKVDFNFELKGLNDEVIGHAGENIANLLISEVKGDAVKFFDWAMSFNKKQVVQMDESDLNKLKDLISNTERMPIVLKAPMLKYLNTLK